MGFKVSLFGLHTDMLIVICCIVLRCLLFMYAPSYSVFMFVFLGSLIRYYLVAVFLKWGDCVMFRFARSSL